MPLRADLALFGQRRFRLLFSARTVSVLGNVLGPIGIAFGVLGLPGASPVTLSIVLVAHMVPRLALLLLGGVIGDRLPRYRVLVVAEALACAAFGALAAMVLTGWAPLGMLILVAAIAGTASAVALPSLVGIVAETVERTSLQQANALLKLGTNSASILGLAIGGTVIATIGPGWALAADALTYALSAVLLRLLRLPPATRSSGRNLRADLRQGWREFAGRQWLWSVVTAAAFINAGSRATFGLLGPIVAGERLGGAPGWAAVLAAYSIGMFLGVLVALRLRPARPLVVAVCGAVALGLPALVLGFAAPLPIVLAAAFVAGIASDIFSVLWATTFQREVPQESMSRVSAYEWLGALSVGPLGMAAAGPLVVSIGAERTLLTVAAVMAVAPLATLTSRQVRTMRTRTEPIPQPATDKELAAHA